MKVGFTGTKNGMTIKQQDVFKTYIAGLQKISEFHHGDCVGADEEAAHIVLNMYTWDVMHCHPPDSSRWQAMTLNKHSYPPAPYLERNQDIIDAVDRLIAAPNGYHEIMRSGTWATVRYARRKGIPIFIIYRDGTTAMES